MQTKLLVCASMCALAAAARAEEADRVLPCRPTVACGTAIAPPGQLEIEAGVLHRGVGGGSAESAPILFKLSLTDFFQLQLGTNGPTFVSGQGGHTFLDASQVLAKFSWPLGEGLPGLGFTAALNLPTEAGIEKRTDALFALLFSAEAATIHADFNAGLNLLAVDAAAAPQWWTALSLTREFPHGLTGMIEGWHSGAAGALAGRDGGFLFALGWSPWPSICFDAGGDVAILGSDRSFSAFAGVSLTAARLWRPAGT